MGRKDSKYVLKLDHLRSTYIFLNNARSLVIRPFFQYRDPFSPFCFNNVNVFSQTHYPTRGYLCHQQDRYAMFSSIPASLT